MVACGWRDLRARAVGGPVGEVTDAWRTASAAVARRLLVQVAADGLHARMPGAATPTPGIVRATRKA